MKNLRQSLSPAFDSPVSVIRLVFICLFLLMVATPGVLLLVGVQDAGGIENRAATPMPVPDVQRLDAFPEEFGTWFQEHFPGRSWLIRLRRQLGAGAFKEAISQAFVVEGKEGWYFKGNVHIKDYTHQKQYTRAQLRKIRALLDQRQAWCAERGIAYYLFLIPHKARIYPEFLPDGLEPRKPWSRMDQVVLMAEEHSLPVYSLKPALVKARSLGQLFLKGDNHWTDLGAWVACNQIRQVLSRRFPGMEALRLADFYREAGVYQVPALEQMSKGEEVPPEPCIKLLEKNEEKHFQCQPCDLAVPEDFPYPWGYCQDCHATDSVPRPSALIIRDSYLDNLQQLYKAPFSEAILLWDEWKYQLPRELVEQRKPDMVITIMPEEYLDKLLEGEEYP